MFQYFQHRVMPKQLASSTKSGNENATNYICRRFGSNSTRAVTISLSHSYGFENPHRHLLEGNRGICSMINNHNLMSRMSRVIGRSMVTITKTSSSDPSPEIQVQSSTGDFGNFGSQTSQSSSSFVVQQSDDSLIITESAVRQIHHLASMKRPDNPSVAYLRVYVDSGGCSGFEYKFEIGYKDGDNEEDIIDPEEDIVIDATCMSQSESDGTENVQACVVVDETSLGYIKGSTIDFVREMIRSSFAVVDNPQSESACGCGSSFAVKNFEANPALD